MKVLFFKSISLFLSERVKLFHVDEICMGIKSIVLYSPGLTCQKKYISVITKTSSFFHIFNSSKTISPASACLPFCGSLSPSALLSLSLHLTLQ